MDEMLLSLVVWVSENDAMVQLFGEARKTIKASISRCFGVNWRENNRDRRAFEKNR